MRYLILLFFIACAWADDVGRIFAARCTGCHSAATKMGGLNIESYDSIKKVIVPGRSAESRLYLMVSGKASPVMPAAGPRLTAGELETVRAWIDAGAAPFTLASAATRAVPIIKPQVPVKPQNYDLAWSPDSKTIALAGYKQVRLIDAASKQQIASLDGASDAVRSLAFSRDGALLAAAGGLPARSGEVQIWSVPDRKLLRTFKGHSDCIYAAVFSPDGKSLATSSYDKLIKLWDVATGKEIRTLKDHIDAIYALAFTPDGTRLISGAADRAVKVWNVSTGERLYTLSEPQDGINAVAVDPSGKYVAAGGLDKSIRIWSIGEKSGTLVNSQIAHEDAILRLAWSPDGKYLASSSADKTVKIFTAPDLTEVKSFTEPDWVYGLQFSPAGKTLAVAAWSGPPSLLPLPPVAIATR